MMKAQVKELQKTNRQLAKFLHAIEKKSKEVEAQWKIQVEAIKSLSRSTDMLDLSTLATTSLLFIISVRLFPKIQRQC